MFRRKVSSGFMANDVSAIQSSLLSKMNERQVLRAIQTQGPMSRAEVARYAGISAPTASKAVEALLRAGFLEEGLASDAGRGRPARKLNLPGKSVQVLGLVLAVCRRERDAVFRALLSERKFRS